MNYLPDNEEKENRVFVTLWEGIGLGQNEYLADIRNRIIHLKTFISNDIILESQEEVSNSTADIIRSSGMNCIGINGWVRLHEISEE